MKKIVLTTLLLLPLGGCSDHSYIVHKNGSTYDQQQADIGECKYKAEAAAAGQENPFVANSERDTLATQCMQVKGYTVTRTN